MQYPPGRFLWPALVALLVLACCVSIMVRPGGLSYQNLGETVVFWLPRLLLGLVAGGALALNGAALQGLLRNPLADPFTLGVASGGALGSGAVMALGLSSSVLLPVGGMAGSFGAATLVYLLARNRGRFTVTGMVLAGVIVSLLCSSLLMLLIVLSRRQLSEAVFQAMGHLNVVFTRESVQIAAAAGVIVLAGCIWLQSYARALDILSLSEETALSLGVDAQVVTRVVFVLSAVVVGLVSAFCGAVSFVGLVVPHLCRMLFGPSHTRLLGSSFLMGAGVLTLADVLARSIGSGGLPLSVVTAFVGVPLFIYLLRTKL